VLGDESGPHLLGGTASLASSSYLLQSVHLDPNACKSIRDPDQFNPIIKASLNIKSLKRLCPVAVNFMEALSHVLASKKLNKSIF
jgi:hypothetical protein